MSDKILHVVPYFYPAWGYGGTPRAVYEIAKRQVKKGFDVTVFTTDAYEKNKTLKKSFEEVDGIKIKRFKSLSNFATWKFHFPIPQGLISEDLSKFDIIHLHETRNLLNLLVIRKIQRSIFYSPWGTLPYNNQQEIVKKIFDKAFVNKLRRKTLTSLAQNEHELLILEKWKMGRNKRLLPLGIDTKFFKEIPSKIYARKKLGLVDKDKIFLFLGRFSEAKGIGLLINSFIKSFKSSKNTKLLLVGRDDGYLKKISQSQNDQIIISDPLYDKDRLIAYAAADFFVFTPTIYEETSTACLEALACKRPVITTHQAQIPFLKPSDGVFHINATIDDISKTMREITNKKIQVNSKKLLKHFEWDNIVNKLNDLYYDTKNRIRK